MASVAFIGLIVFSNSLFVSNFIFIRSERNLADAETIAKRHNEAETTESPTEESTRSCPRVEAFLGGIFYGFCCGVVRKETCSVHRFRDWNPVRYRLGVLSTSALLVLITALFSEEGLKRLGVDPGGGGSSSSSPQLCSRSDKEEHLLDLREALEDETRISLARRQNDFTGKYLSALLNDTELYGTHGHECTMEPRTKEAYYGSPGYTNETGMDFFPGHCGAAQELALKNAREETCTKEVCVDSTVEVDVVDVEMNGVKGAWDYLQGGQDAVIKTSKEEIDVQGCKDVVVPCPNSAQINDMDDVLDGYLQQQQQVAEQKESLSFTVELAEEKDEVISKLEEKGGEVLARLIKQIDIASSAYVAYLCISLFFPAPLYIFRSTYTVTAKRYLFGAQKHVFILVVLAIWWGIRYFRTFAISIELQLYMQGLLKDPCYVDADFLEEAPQTLKTICDELESIQSEWVAKSFMIEATMQEVDAFRDMCKCEFPCQYLCEVLPNSTDLSTITSLREIQFRLSADQDNMCFSCDGVDVLIQESRPNFMGNTTLCDDPSLANEVFLSMAPEAFIDGWNLWIQSGLLAMILVKTFIANFGVSTLHLADPMSLCDGEFEGPPSSQDFRSTHELKMNCEHNLRMIAARRCFFWGGIANACLLNIMATTFQTENGIEVPMSTGIIFFLTALVPPVLTYCGTRSTKARILELQMTKETTESEVGNELPTVKTY